MQFLTGVRQKVAQLISENATVLLTAGGVVGTVGTGFLAARGGIKAARILDDLKQHKANEINRGHDGSDPDKIAYAENMTVSKAEIALTVGPQFIPPVIIGTATIASIIFSHRMSAQKAAALAAAYGLAERNLGEYKEKLAEHLTGPKKEKLETEIAQDRVNKTPGHDSVIIIEGDGDVLCFDAPTGRYFKSNPEKIRRAVNSANAEILRHGGASASQFYDELELPPTSWSDEVGWGIGEQIEINFDYVKDPHDRPCLSIDFKKLPSMDWNSSYS